MRGVYHAVPPNPRIMFGSSPHARGLLRSCGRRRVGSVDHPRMRGVYGDSQRGYSQARGSSPHARGLHGLAEVAGVGAGIIPACAGFTRTSSAPRPARRDHPRMRGVYLSGAVGRVSLSGSSPHARGLPAHPEHLLRVPGIIPACAGFTRERSGGSGRPRDHPRMRGVYVTGVGGVGVVAGSSPHARGLRHAPAHVRRHPGIIPACAGFTTGRGWLR